VGAIQSTFVHQVIGGGEIVNPDALSEAIRSLVQQTKSNRKKINTAIWGTAVITKKISIPRIDEKLVGDQLKWEAEQYIPFDVNESNLEYQVIHDSNSPEQMNVLLVAAKRDYVMRYAEVIAGAGLECSIIDVAGFALANCFEANYGKLQGQNVILLNIGAGTTDFVVMEHGEVTFSRDIPVGGLSYTSDISKAMGVSLEEAENLKISAGTGQPVPKEVSDIIAQTSEAVAEEIRRSYDFYLAGTSEVKISRVYVTGGGLGIPGLFEGIQNTLGIAMENLNPFASIQYDSRVFNADYINQISPYAGVGLGLALREVGDR
jgi:type IV pilus assembly protein PilM